MRRAINLILLAISLALVGCASKDPASQDSVSSIPWNRPQSWEGQGPLGSMMQGAGGGR
jgi:hypothetical protein